MGHNSDSPSLKVTSHHLNVDYFSIKAHPPSCVGRKSLHMGKTKSLGMLVLFALVCLLPTPEKCFVCHFNNINKSYFMFAVKYFNMTIHLIESPYNLHSGTCYSGNLYYLTVSEAGTLYLLVSSRGLCLKPWFLGAAQICWHKSQATQQHTTSRMTSLNSTQCWSCCCFLRRSPNLKPEVNRGHVVSLFTMHSSGNKLGPY